MKLVTTEAFWYHGKKAEKYIDREEKLYVSYGRK